MYTQTIATEVAIIPINISIPITGESKEKLIVLKNLLDFLFFYVTLFTRFYIMFCTPDYITR